MAGIMVVIGDKLIPKTEDEFDAEDIKKVENYAKAINMLYCAVNPDDYRKISCCSTAKEMWDKLEVTYEGTDQVREAKIDFLTQEYEMFRMKEHEKIDDMFDRFSKIVNDLHALKKTYTDRDLVRKILRSLTSEWRSKADVMKKFCTLLKKKEKVEDGPVCYGCGEAGHIKKKCLKSGRNARHFKRQRAYISWGGDSGDESIDQDEDEATNLCLMAHEDQTDDVQEDNAQKKPYYFFYFDEKKNVHIPLPEPTQITPRYRHSVQVDWNPPTTRSWVGQGCLPDVTATGVESRCRRTILENLSFVGDLTPRHCCTDKDDHMTDDPPKDATTKKVWLRDDARLFLQIRNSIDGCFASAVKDARQCLRIVDLSTRGAHGNWAVALVLGFGLHGWAAHLGGLDRFTWAGR
ncbi:unnamed protein product [Cuscuta campestris]|uniref:CCHC-type domain-containing protein n=1 Tax=Cuscuta campestris TaxID=132261 RepID=A0A484NKP8_9ASTE|nr:unnamed protein product [Cuscuta campestris]